MDSILFSRKSIGFLILIREKSIRSNTYQYFIFIWEEGYCLANSTHRVRSLFFYVYAHNGVLAAWIFPRVLLETRHLFASWSFWQREKWIIFTKVDPRAVTYYIDDYHLQFVVFVKCCINFPCMAMAHERRSSC